MIIDTELLRQRLEEVGEDGIRECLAEGTYDPQARPIVEEWLRGKDTGRMREYIKVARSASYAAWVAAIVAVASALAAIVAWLR